MGQPIVVASRPRILRNLREICEEMGVGPQTVKKWVRQGAPIAVEGEGSRQRYSAEGGQVQAWRIARSFAEERGDDKKRRIIDRPADSEKISPTALDA